MRIIGLDTSSKILSVSIVENGSLISEQISTNPLQSSTHILPLIDSLLLESNLTLLDIDAFAIAIGPGSFTGLRIGLAVCKGINFALRRPVLGIKTLDGLAQTYSGAGQIIPLLDARRGEVYAAIYSNDGICLTKKSADMVINIHDLCKKVDKSAIFYGDGAKRYEEEIKVELGSLAKISIDKPRFSVATGIALLGASRFKDGKCEDYRLLKPNYLRRSEAEIKLEEKLKGDA